MSIIMDKYFNATDSMSLQEMLDIDIKSDIETLIGGHNDLSGLNFAELPPLELDDVTDIRWFSNNSNSSFTLDFSSNDAKMVNPNVVMPVLSLAQNIRSPSPQLKESHLTFSPSCIKVTSSNLNVNNKPAEVEAVKHNLIKKLDNHVVIEKPVEKKLPIIKAINKITPILSKPIIKAVTKTTPTLLTFKNTINRQIATPITVAQLTALGATHITSAQGRKQQFNNNRLNGDDLKAFPKPAYSYSCLIAMALKNSRTGSLPVSEIYNFMCKHFPYFKTAPNGWKNSVRHNLSLNKCFEKIEKPALNGTQRKGCLWAMNPAKISKMDEEVQKWSRKDPSAIKKAMVNPENLEALERGEMKFSCSFDEDNYSDPCGSAESEEGSDCEPDMENNIRRNTQTYIDVRTIKTATLVKQETYHDGLVGETYQVEVSDSMYDDDEIDIEEDQEILRMEMALAQKELLAYETVDNRRRKTFIIHN